MRETRVPPGLNKVVPRSFPPFMGRGSAFFRRRKGGLDMFNPRDTGSPAMRHAWLLFATVAVVALVSFGDIRLSRPKLSGLGIAGIAIMALGAVMALAAGRLASRLPEEKRNAAVPVMKLTGVLVCGIGALMVFLGA